MNLRVARRPKGSHVIADQVNQDKINYSKLSSYNLKDTDFIQAFMEEAKHQQ